MPGNAIKIGPFLGGLNNISTSGEAKDNELVELVNMDVAKDQSLTMRPVITEVPGTNKRYTTNLLWDIHGIYRLTQDEWYVIASVPSGNGTQNLVLFTSNDFTTPAYTIRAGFTATNKVTGIAQYQSTLYILMAPGATTTCFKWSKTGGATDIPSMPKGHILISWKSRLWVASTLSAVNGDRVWFSKVGASGPEPDVWETNDYFNVAPGEGGFITAMLPSFNNLIVFKNDGTWRFSFPSSPKQGTIDKISGQVGAASKNSVIEFENFIYVYDQGSVYELVNSNYAKLNVFIRFDEDTKAVDGIAPGVELSVVNRRLIIRYFNAIYVFTIDTKAWSMWRTINGTPGRWLELPVDSNSANSSVFIAPTRGTVQSPGKNLIKDSTLEISDNQTIWSEMDTPFSEPFKFVAASSDLEFTFRCNVEVLNGTGGVRIQTLSKSGATSSSSTSAFRFTATGTQELVIRYADVQGLRIGVYANSGATVKVSQIYFGTSQVSSAAGLLKVSSEFYEESSQPIEPIEATMLTKTYDYQAATSFKRLFYWGADLVTSRPIHAEARPVGKRNKILWGDLEAYTHEQLEQGTWGNPLSWLTRSNAVVSMTDANVDISENGRFYVKLAKNLRFRQIAFFLKLSSYGNSASGPAKVFALTTLVNPKKDTIDTAS